VRSKDTGVHPVSTDLVGSRRLLHDLAVVGLVYAEQRPARERLEEALGPDLAYAVVGSLVEPTPAVQPGSAHPRAA
jgi:hypothetical protein